MSSFEAFKKFLDSLPKSLDTKSDLDKLSPKQRDLYDSYRKDLEIKGNKKPSTVVEEFKKYKKTGLFFKSNDIGFDLKDTGDFNDKDKYRSSKKRVAIVTNALQKAKSKLSSLTSKMTKFDIAYKKTIKRKGVGLLASSLGFTKYLPDNFFVNIKGTNYNKSGIDFLNDYHGMSADYTKNLLSLVENFDITIFKN